MFSEAKKESVAFIKDEAAICRRKLNDLLDNQKEKLEQLASQNSDKISKIIDDFLKYFFKGKSFVCLII